MSLHRRDNRTQRGVTLIVVLLILVVVTILGLGGAQIALQGERSTRYDRDYLIASQSAEAALMDAEFDIRGPGGSRQARFNQSELGLFVAGCSNNPATRGLCLPYAAEAKPVWAQIDFLESDETIARSVKFGTYTGRSFDAGTLGVKPAHPPRYIIELIDDSAEGNNAGAGSSGSAAKLKMYRVTAIGFGPREDIQVVMQMTFRKERV